MNGNQIRILSWFNISHEKFLKRDERQTLISIYEQNNEFIYSISIATRNMETNFHIDAIFVRNLTKPYTSIYFKHSKTVLSYV